eukprot:46313-Prorocentrum_minimum.AAC.1
MRRGAEIVREGLERLCLLASASPSADADGRVNQADLRACLSNACPELSRLDQRVVLIHLAEVTDGPGALNMEEVLQFGPVRSITQRRHTLPANQISLHPTGQSNGIYAPRRPISLHPCMHHTGQSNGTDVSRRPITRRRWSGGRTWRSSGRRRPPSPWTPPSRSCGAPRAI